MKVPFYLPTYDLIIVGAGPAGLGAARTAARLGLRTLILEKQPRLEALNDPSLAALESVPDLITARIRCTGVYYPELELLIPALFLKGAYTRKQYLTPAGSPLPSLSPDHHPFPSCVVNQIELRQQLAGQACAAGAELRLGSRAMGLLRDSEGRVTGVRTGQGTIHAPIVLSAEGNSRRLYKELGLPCVDSRTVRHAFVVSQEMIAPAAGPNDLGQIVTFGRRYTSAPQVIGRVIVPEPGRALATLTVFTEQPRRYAGNSLWVYLNEYVDEDPRVCRLFAGATVVDRSGGRLAYYGRAGVTAADGFLAAGDTLSPWGHLGILPAIYLGQKAARLAAEAIGAGDTSRRRLSAYERLYVRPLLRLLQEQHEQLLLLAGLADESLDGLAHHRYERLPFAALPLANTLASAFAAV
jgi:flavin-dependent dehydrogenase